MAIFGTLSTPQKELPLIDIGNADIMMELLEEVAIATATHDWIRTNQPHHPEAAEIEDQAKDVMSDFLAILHGQVKDKRMNPNADWTTEDLVDHLHKGEKTTSKTVIEDTVNRFLDQFLMHSRATKEDGTPAMSRLEYYAFMSGWAHYFAGLAPDEHLRKSE